jgi:hypothetical protein
VTLAELVARIVVGVLMLGLLVFTGGLMFSQIRENRREGRKVVVPWWGWVLFVAGLAGSAVLGIVVGRS